MSDSKHGSQHPTTAVLIFEFFTHRRCQECFHWCLSILLSGKSYGGEVWIPKWPVSLVTTKTFPLPDFAVSSNDPPWAQAVGKKTCRSCHGHHLRRLSRTCSGFHSSVSRGRVDSSGAAFFTSFK